MSITAQDDLLAELWDNRVDFFKYILKQTPTDQQGDALVALDNGDFVTVKSGHGCGKSFVEAGTVIHYMCTRPFCRIPCTAPTKHQLYDVLWAELAKLHRQMHSGFAAQFEWTKERFFRKSDPEEWFAVARTATKENPEAIQGFHGEYVYVVIDEASGVPEQIFEVTEGATGTIETKMLMCANPTRLDGTFYDSHNKLKQFYKPLTWSCLDSPIVHKSYAPRMAKKFGTESNIYRVRVLGQFPNRAGDSFIPYDLVEAALIREIPPQTEYPKIFGVDVARYGDDRTVIAVRQGDIFHPYHVLRNKSTMEVSGYVAMLANKEKPKHIFIDIIGLGSGVYDRLYELGFPVIPVNVSESPALNPQNYRRLRDELWGNMRDWLEMRRGRLWDNDEGDLAGELTKPKYHMTSDGKIIIESKEDMRKHEKDDFEKRGNASPDIADAHILTFAMPIADYINDDDDFDVIMRSDSHGSAVLDREMGY